MKLIAVVAIIVVLVELLAGCASSSTVTSPPAPPPTMLQVTAPDEWTPPAQTATSGCHLRAGNPDPACTPGALNPRVTPANIATTVCHHGWAGAERKRYLPVNRSQKLKATVRGFYVDAPADLHLVEGDHLIPIELGGDPAGGPGGRAANFWDEPHTVLGPDGRTAGSFNKDAFENWLNLQVCHHGLALNEAREQVAVDWYAAYNAAGRPRDPYNHSNRAA